MRERATIRTISKCEEPICSLSEGKVSSSPCSRSGSIRPRRRREGCAQDRVPSGPDRSARQWRSTDGRWARPGLNRRPPGLPALAEPVVAGSLAAGALVGGLVWFRIDKRRGGRSISMIRLSVSFLRPPGTCVKQTRIRSVAPVATGMARAETTTRAGALVVTLVSRCV
jgi:hypothetical protein